MPSKSQRRRYNETNAAKKRTGGIRLKDFVKPATRKGRCLGIFRGRGTFLAGLLPMASEVWGCGRPWRAWATVAATRSCPLVHAFQLFPPSWLDALAWRTNKRRALRFEVLKGDRIDRKAFTDEIKSDSASMLIVGWVRASVSDIGRQVALDYRSFTTNVFLFLAPIRRRGAFFDISSLGNCTSRGVSCVPCMAWFWSQRQGPCIWLTQMEQSANPNPHYGWHGIFDGTWKSAAVGFWRWSTDRPATTATFEGARLPFSLGH